LANFDNARFSGLFTITLPGSLTPDQQREVNDLLESFNGHIELRVVHPVIGIEESMRKVEPDDQISSLFLAPIGRNAHRISSLVSAPIDLVNALPEHQIQRLCKLSNLELVQLSAPRRSLSRVEGIDTCQKALKYIWRYTPHLRKVILPLDLLEHLAPAFEVLKDHGSLNEVELTAPENDEVFRSLLRQGDSCELVMTRLSPFLARLTRLEAITIPVSFLSAGFLAYVAPLPTLFTLTIVPVESTNSVNHLLGGLRAASIHGKAPRRFEKLMYLDLGTCDRSQRHFLNTPEHVACCRALRRIFTDTTFDGGDQLFVF
jgi:hypothetical protein